MSKTRMEAFSDGVIAILLTIMVFDLKAPSATDFSALATVFPAVLTYLLSFAHLGIYWNNHHHMLHLITHVNGAILCANMHLLFWLSLIPFGTAWMRSSNFAPIPVFVYGMILLLSAIAWTILQATLIAHQGPESSIRAAVGRDSKAFASTAIYSVALPMAFFLPAISIGCFVLVALLWLIPDRRFERQLEPQSQRIW